MVKATEGITISASSYPFLEGGKKGGNYFLLLEGKASSYFGWTRKQVNKELKTQELGTHQVGLSEYDRRVPAALLPNYKNVYSLQKNRHESFTWHIKPVKSLSRTSGILKTLSGFVFFF